MGNVLPKIDGPVLMPWASDLEAVGRDGGCVTYDIANATTVRYDSSLSLSAHAVVICV